MPPTPSLSTISTNTPDEKRAASISGSSFRIRRDPGFLGVTSYGSIFKENILSLGIDGIERDTETTTKIMSEEKIRKGVEILSLLKHLPAFEIFIQRWFDISQGILVTEPMVKQWTESLWSFHGDVLLERNPEQMRQLSELVFRNTHRPLKFDGTTSARRWTAMSSGPQLRWEVVGIIFCLVGLLAVTLPDSDEIFTHLKDMNMDKRTLCRTMDDAADYCECFCSFFGVAHDLQYWLEHEHLVLTATIRGDADVLVWKRAGELFNSVLALGLHEDKSPNKDTPFFLSEMRKKTFLYTFCGDKGLSTFLGRPPRLLSRYCLVQLPLDLSEKQLFAEGQELQDAINSLDENGWNQKGEIRRTTWARVWLINALIREEVLDLSLGINTVDYTGRAEEITRKMKEANAGLPDYLKQSVENTEKLRRPVMEQLCVLYTRLQLMTNDLLLQRVLIRKAGVANTQLVFIARCIFEEVVKAAVRRDLMRDFQVDYADLLANHGLRSGAILAVELLKQEHYPNSASAETLPRSQTIQNLSVFVSCLASIDPGDGMYATCEQGRKVFKRVLDKVLSPSVPKPPSAPPATADIDIPLPPLNFDFGLQPTIGGDSDLLQWLDNMEWERGSMMGFN